MISSVKYRSEAATSPGIEKPDSEERWMLWARPTPLSNIPPHHTGIP